MDDLDRKVYESFAGRVVKKGATKLIKGASNVPTYVLEYLLGTYCSSDDEKEIDKGIEQVKRILAENYVRNDEVNLIKSRIRDNETYNVIDVVDARFNERGNFYVANLHNMGISDVIDDQYIKDNERSTIHVVFHDLNAIFIFKVDASNFIKSHNIPHAN